MDIFDFDSNQDFANVTSKYGGFYANDFQFDRTVKMTFILLFIVQVVLVAAMYAYYRWEERTK